MTTSAALDTGLVALLDGTPIAHLASVLPDGAPHSVPVWVGTHKEHVVIMTGPGSQKARNLQRDPTRRDLSDTGRRPVLASRPARPCRHLALRRGGVGRRRRDRRKVHPRAV
jgi:hypothetical protein